MPQDDSLHKLFEHLIKKSTLKQEVYGHTFESFKIIKKVSEKLSKSYEQFTEQQKDIPKKIPFESRMKGDFEIELRFGGDILLFLMHTNIFEMPRDHGLLRTSYVREDLNRSYCGIISIYNFLTDSFKYNRINDIGYMIGRIFVNHDRHYFVQGKKELSYLYNDFGKNKLDESSAQEIIMAAIQYTVNFDLLTPPYDQVKTVSVKEMINTLDAISIKTGKRLGFQFKADEETLE